MKMPGHAQFATLLLAASVLAGCGAREEAAPRRTDGTILFDRVKDEKGFWDLPSVASLAEAGVSVEMDARGKLKDPADAARVAPFQPWALALYQHRQQNDFADDPMLECIGPGNPRQMMTPGGVRFIEDRNFRRMYMIYGGGNRNWRTVFLDGREPPNPDEVNLSFLGLAVGRWEGDTLVVDSTGYNTRFWMSNGGLPHTEALRLTERFSRPSHDELRYEVEIDDSRTYTRTWKAGWTLKWVAGDIQEQFCETGRE
ncbi:MAG TPA: hypothetical protein VMK82_05665 [Steroidobacteraceae bacterium]|nr:hypothetical protein [Steroidobacteraceae bacterium]